MLETDSEEPVQLQHPYANVGKGSTAFPHEWNPDKDLNATDLARLPTVFFCSINQPHKEVCKTLATRWEQSWIQTVVNHQGSHCDAYYSRTKCDRATEKSNQVLVHLWGKKHQMKPIRGNYKEQQHLLLSEYLFSFIINHIFLFLRKM